MSILVPVQHTLDYPATAAKSPQSCLTLCGPRDGSPPGLPIPGILQARTLEWVAISFSKAWKWKVKVKSLSRVWLLTTPWTAAHQTPPSMGFSRQEYWSGVLLPSLDYPNFAVIFEIRKYDCVFWGVGEGGGEILCISTWILGSISLSICTKKKVKDFHRNCIEFED